MLITDICIAVIYTYYALDNEFAIFDEVYINYAKEPERVAELFYTITTGEIKSHPELASIIRKQFLGMKGGKRKLQPRTNKRIKLKKSKAFLILKSN